MSITTIILAFIVVLLSIVSIQLVLGIKWRDKKIIKLTCNVVEKKKMIESTRHKNTFLEGERTQLGNKVKELEETMLLFRKNGYGDRVKSPGEDYRIIPYNVQRSISSKELYILDLNNDEVLKKEQIDKLKYALLEEVKDCITLSKQTNPMNGDLLIKAKLYVGVKE